MAWSAGFIQDLLRRSNYNVGLGRVGAEAERAIIEAVRQNQPAIDFANPQLTVITNANSTAQIARSSVGRVYLAIVTNTDDDSIGVVFTDGGNTIVTGGALCPAQIAAVAGVSPAIPGCAKVAWFESPNAAGQRVLTDLRVRAFKSSDGTTAADNGCQVIVLHGA